MRRFVALLLTASFASGVLGPVLAAMPVRAASGTPAPFAISGPHLMLPDPDVYPTVPFAQTSDGGIGPGTRGGLQTTGTVDVLVILIRFTDQSESTSSAAFNTRVNDATSGASSVHNYYQEVSYGQLTLRFTVVGWFSSAHTMSYYGADTGSGYDDANGPVYRLTTEAVQVADANGVNFAPFDGNGDGVVDHVLIVHAGDAEESDTNNANLIWSHRWSVIDANPGVPGNQALTADGVQIYGYTMVSETSPVGVIAHEFGHDLGLPDLYDTDGSSSGGVGEWDIMATGSWNGSPRGSQPAEMSAWSKTKLGWVAPVVVTSARLNQTIGATETAPVAFKLPIRSSSSGDEYFLVENREGIGFDAALPGPGLLIWHVDDSVSGNEDETHRLLNLEQADGNDKPTQAGDAWSSNPTGWGPDTTPNSNSYLNARTGWKVRNIGAPGAQVVADLSREVDDDLLVLGVQRPCCVPTGATVTVYATVGNHGARLQQNFAVNLTVYHGSVDAANVVCCGGQIVSSLAQGDSQTLSWNIVVSAPGKYIFDAYVPLALDEIPENNRMFAHFNAATYYLYDDVESGVGGWARNGSGLDPARWEIVQDGNRSVSHSPTHAWRFGPVGGVCVLCPDFHTLTSADVNVPGGPVYLSFWHTYDLRGRVEVNGSVESDVGYVNVSINGGPWRNLGFINGTQPDWQAFFADLTSLVSGPSTVAVQLSASSGAVQASGGWWVDDIAISNAPLSRGLIAQAVTPTQSVDPGGVAIFLFKLANVGDFDDDIAFALQPPPGWTAAIGQNETQMAAFSLFRARLSPDADATLLLGFQVSADVQRGSRYTVPVTASSTADSSIATTFSVLTIINDPFGLGGLERYVFFFLVALAAVIVIAVVVDSVKKQKGVYRRW